MKPLRYYLQKAYKEGWAIGQFNFSDFSEAKGIIEAAKKLKAPIILGTSEGESNFFGLEEAVGMRNVLRKKTSLPIFLNLDHGKSIKIIKEAIDAGYDMVHFDGSKIPLEENIKISREVMNLIRWKGVIVEGEVGRIGTDASKLYSEKFEIKEEDLTKVTEASEYVKKTGTNLLAVSIGNFHGIDVTGTDPHLNLDKLKEIRNYVKIPLVLHGGSGISAENINAAIKLGIAKININTELRVAFSATLRDTLLAHEEEIVPYKYFPAVVEAVQKITEEKIRLFGSENKA